MADRSSQTVTRFLDAARTTRESDRGLLRLLGTARGWRGKGARPLRALLVLDAAPGAFDFVGSNESWARGPEREVAQRRPAGCGVHRRESGLQLEERSAG